MVSGGTDAALYVWTAKDVRAAVVADLLICWSFLIGVLRLVGCTALCVWLFVLPVQLRFANIGVSHAHDGAITAVKFVDDITVVSASKDGLVRVNVLPSKLRGKVAAPC